MCWQLSNFSQFFDYGFGLLTASAVVQELAKERVFNLDFLRMKLRSMAREIDLDDDSLEDLDTVAALLRTQGIAVEKTLAFALNFSRLWLGVGIFCVLMISFGASLEVTLDKDGSLCSSPARVLTLATISLLWGPTVFFCFWYYAKRTCDPLEEVARNMRANIFRSRRIKN